MKFIHNSTLKRFLLLFFLLMIFIIINAFSYVNAISSSISSSLLRLHVVSNSNSIEDLSLKYTVRDSVLIYIDEISTDLENVDEVLSFVKNNISEISQVAQNSIYSMGYSYPVNVQLGNFRFPSKQYGNIRLPAGLYNALKIEIGNGYGSNWWCVMFPPLCFVDISSAIISDSSKEVIQESLLPEEYRLISDNSPEVRLKFRVVEVFQSIASRI